MSVGYTPKPRGPAISSETDVGRVNVHGFTLRFASLPEPDSCSGKPGGAKYGMCVGDNERKFLYERSIHPEATRSGQTGRRNRLPASFWS